eukprot:41735-Prymnesium_polylepis.1
MQRERQTRPLRRLGRDCDSHNTVPLVWGWTANRECLSRGSRTVRRSPGKADRSQFPRNIWAEGARSLSAPHCNNPLAVTFLQRVLIHCWSIGLEGPGIAFGSEHVARCYGWLAASIWCSQPERELGRGGGDWLCGASWSGSTCRVIGTGHDFSKRDSVGIAKHLASRMPEFCGVPCHVVRSA